MAGPSDYFRREVAYRVPRMDEVAIQKDIAYVTVAGGPLYADVYRPPASGAALLPAVIFVHGDASPDLLRDMKDSGQYVSWGRLMAASGLAAVTFNHRSSRRRTMIHEPASDVDALFRFVVDRARDLGMDATRLAVWVCSAGPPFVLPALLRNELPLARGVAVFYGLMDLEHLRAHIPPEVSDETLRAYSPLAQLRDSTGAVPPLLLVRTGRDDPGFNDSIDRFVAVALQKNLAVEVINLPEAEHGCDVRSDAPDVRDAVRRTLDFLRAVLSAPHSSA